MDINEATAVGFFKERFYIGDHFYNEDGSPMKKKELYIVLREPTAAELQKFGSTNKDEAAQIKALQQLLPKCILESNFTSGEEDATAQEVGAVIMNSSSLFFYLQEVWQKSLPLAKRNAAILKEQEDQSSTEK